MLLEDDVVEPRYPLLEAGFLVGFEEKCRVAEPGPDYPFVAGDDLDRVLALYIGDGDEIGPKLAVGVHHMEILLVLLHG